MRNSALTAVISCLVVVGPACAAEDKAAPIMQAMTRFGLRGIWSPDCFKPVAPDNPRMSIEFQNQHGLEINTQKGNKADINSHETMLIAAAVAIPPDMLSLRLNGVTWREWDGIKLVDHPEVYDRVDTYQKIGDRMLLFRSEVTSGPKPGLVVNKGMALPTPNANFHTLSPVLERCQN